MSNKLIYQIFILGCALGCVQGCSSYSVKTAEKSIELPLLSELWPDTVSHQFRGKKVSGLDSRTLPRIIETVAAQVKQYRGERTDLLEAMAFAQQSDPKFSAAQATHELSIREIGVARTRLYGRLDSRLSIEKDRIADSLNIEDSTTEELGLVLVQPLYNKPFSMEVEQALLKKNLADSQIQVAYDEMLTRVIKAYVKVLKAVSEIEFRQLDYNSIERQVLQSKKLFRLGSITSTDIAEITAQQDQALAARIKAEADYAKAMDEFSAVTGLATNTDLSKLDLSIPLTPPYPDSADAWVSLALQHNKLVQVGKKTADVARHRIALKRADRLPTVALNGLASKFFSAEEPSDDDYYTSIELKLDMPIFDGGRTGAGIARERSAANAAAHQAGFTRRDEARKVKSLYHDVLSSIYTANALNQALRSNQEAIKAVEAGFRFGARTALELLRTRRSAFQSKSRMERAYLDYLESSLLLHLSAGILTQKELQRFSQWLK